MPATNSGQLKTEAEIAVYEITIGLLIRDMAKVTGASRDDVQEIYSDMTAEYVQKMMGQ